MPMPDWKPEPIMSNSEYAVLPSHLLNSIHRYVRQGIMPGHFLTALLENDLQAAIAHADNDNCRVLKTWVRYVYNRLPAPCWGDKETVRKWVEEVEDV